MKFIKHIIFSYLKIYIWLIFVFYWCTSGLLFAQDHSNAFNTFKKEYNLKQKDGNKASIDFLKQYLNTFSVDLENKIVEKYLADNLLDLGEKKKADSLYQELIPWFKSKEIHSHLLSSYSNYGTMLYQTGEISEIVKLTDEALDYIEKHFNKLKTKQLQIYISEIYRNIAIAYAIQSGRDNGASLVTSEKYFRKSYKIIKPLNQPIKEGLALMNIGNIKVKSDSITYYWQKALDIFENENAESQVQMVYSNFAGYYIDQIEDYPKGIAFLERVDSKQSTNPDAYIRAIHFTKYGSAFLGLKQFDKAIAKLNTGLSIAKENDLIDLQRESSSLLVEAYKGAGRYREALEIDILYDSIVKEMDRLKVEEIFRETEAKYKTKEQEAEINSLKQEELLKNAQIKQQQLILALVVLVLIFIGFLSYLFWRRSQQRQKINKQLLKLNSDRTRFLVNISHELRTPLALIHGPLQDAIEQLGQKNYSRTERNLNKITNNTQKLIELVDEVLDLSKLDEGFIKANYSAVYLNKFVTRTFFAFESLAVSKKIKWIADINLDESAYDVDENKLEKILTNLLSNAIKHTPKNGEIKMVAFVQNEHLICKISDTGKGISEEALPKIFDRYFQDDSQEKPSGGLGIGLSLVKEFVDILNGEISVESKINGGTSFLLSIPVKVSSITPTDLENKKTYNLETENRPDLNVSTAKIPHILVIEDHLEMADFIQQLLSDFYKVSIANNGKEAIEFLKKEKFDIITVDVMMPEMNGIEFVNHIKQHENWKHIPTIMITALSKEQDKIKGLQLGIDDYIVKPFSGNELKARAKNLIENSIVRQNSNLNTEDESAISTENDFLVKAKKVVEDNIDNTNFTVKEFAEKLFLSERQTNRVLKKIVGMSSLQFIREIKLTKAYSYLENRKFATIAEVAYAVGIENPSYFTRIFSNRFGKNPSEMLL